MRVPSPIPRHNRQGELIGFQIKIRRRGHELESRTFSSEKLAKDWAKQRIAEIEAGVVQKADKAARETVFDELIDDYLKEVTPTKKGSAQEKCKIGVLKRNKLVKKALANLTRQDFANWQKDRSAEVKPGTVVKEINLFHAIIEWGRKHKGIFLAENPASIIKPSADNARDRIFVAKDEVEGEDRERLFEQDERARLFEALEHDDEPQLYLLAILALETAARQGELCALKWQDVDIENRTILIKKGTPGQTRNTGTKNSKNRTVPMSSLAWAALKAFAEGVNDLDTLVFGHLSQNAMKMRFRRITARAGLADFRFHDLRHIATTELLKRGLSLSETMAMTGHDGVTMVRRYSHLAAADIGKKLG